ncbi:MAG: hypothetical protein COA47_06095 [Robiginitomaculum sp.]|nr:MAG: hypothetical protein COA47_06095 [Robiginitomaculum sp.]
MSKSKANSGSLRLFMHDEDVDGSAQTTENPTYDYSTTTSDVFTNGWTVTGNFYGYADYENTSGTLQPGSYQDLIGAGDQTEMNWSLEGGGTQSISVFGGLGTLVIDDFGAWTLSIPAGTTISAQTQDYDFNGDILISFGNGDQISGDTVTIEFDIACFGRDVLITTPTGDLPIHALKVGDLVLDIHGVAHPIRWHGVAPLNSMDLEMEPNLVPIRICAGAMSDNKPTQDLLVSPQHRMIVVSLVAERMFGSRTIMIPAIKLTGWPGIRIDDNIKDVEYHHLLFDTHIALLANGTPSESLLPGKEARRNMSSDALLEVALIYPELSEGKAEAPSPAFPIVQSKPRIKNFLKRHHKNEIPLIPA